MRWLKALLGSGIPADTSVVARFEGRTEGEEHPKGTAVLNDYRPGELGPILDQVALADGQTLSARMKQEQIREMDRWLEGKGDDPLPRAILRLLGDMASRGEALCDQAGINAYWHPGKPPESVYDGPATFAQIIGLRIRLLYQDPKTGGYMKIEFDA